MTDFPYLNRVGKTKDYFDKIIEAGTPSKVSNEWLESLGFKSHNDRYVIGVWKFLGFLDKSNVPTDLWKNYRDQTQSKTVLTQAIQTGYRELYEMYPDANKKTRTTLSSFFITKTGKAQATIDLMVNTFIGLCTLAGLEVAQPSPAELKPEKAVRPMRTEKQIASSPIAPTPIPIAEKTKTIGEIHINIQLVLPATTDPSIYDQLFESLKKHLLSDGK